MPRHDPLPDDVIAMRSVMMRLYHSWYMKEASYPARYVNGQAANLEDNGWIEPVGNGWRITDAGIMAWAKMNAKMLTHQWAIRAEQFDELRARLNINIKSGGSCRKEGCNLPRHNSASGGTEYPFCEFHLHEKWAADTRKRHSKKGITGAHIDAPLQVK